MPLRTLRDFKYRMARLPGVDARGDVYSEKGVVLLADVMDNGTLRALRDDSDVQKLVASHAWKGMVDVEVRKLFPVAGEQNPIVLTVPLRSSDVPVVTRPTSAPSGSARMRSYGLTSNRALQTARPVAVQTRHLRPHAVVSRAEREAVASPPRGTAVSSSASPPVEAPTFGSPSHMFALPAPSEPDPAPNAHAYQLAEFARARSDSPSTPPRSPTYDGRPGGFADSAWEGKSGDLSTHIMEAIGLREEYEHLQHESRQRRAALEWLLRARDSVPGAYSLHLRPKIETAPGGGATIFQSRGSGLRTASSGPQDCNKKGEYWPIKERDVPTLCKAIESLAEMEGTATARLKDQEVCAVWMLSSAKQKMAEEQFDMAGQARLVPRKVLCESRWLKFGEFSNVAFRFYPSGDATAQPGSSTMFVWMKHPPGVSFTFNIRIGRTLSTAPRLWRSTITHYRMDLKWSRIEVLLGTLAASKSPLEITLQVLQWHGAEDDPYDPAKVHYHGHTNVTLALEMLNAASDPSVPPLWPMIAANPGA